MAQTIVIKKGNRQLQDVTKVKPDTRVNLNAAKDLDEALKYPTTDLRNGMVAKTFEDADGTEFVNPAAYIDPDTPAESGSGSESGGK